jgi:hypothetical protein
MEAGLIERGRNLHNQEGEPIMNINGKTFQQQYRRCGKDCTHGPNGRGHGPYWYKSAPGGSLKYVGKDLPEEVSMHLTLLKEKQSTLKKIMLSLEIQEQEADRHYQHIGELRRAVSNLLSGEPLDIQALKELGLEEFVILV